MCIPKDSKIYLFIPKIARFQINHRLKKYSLNHGLINILIHIKEIYQTFTQMFCLLMAIEKDHRFQILKLRECFLFTSGNVIKISNIPLFGGN